MQDKTHTLRITRSRSAFDRYTVAIEVDLSRPLSVSVAVSLALIQALDQHRSIFEGGAEIGQARDSTEKAQRAACKPLGRLSGGRHV